MINSYAHIVYFPGSPLKNIFKIRMSFNSQYYCFSLGERRGKNVILPRPRNAAA